jgi:hypothetical protein
MPEIYESTLRMNHHNAIMNAPKREKYNQQKRKENLMLDESLATFMRESLINYHNSERKFNPRNYNWSISRINTKYTEPIILAKKELHH